MIWPWNPEITYAQHVEDIRAKERERCARVTETFVPWDGYLDDKERDILRWVAAKIRSGQ